MIVARLRKAYVAIAAVGRASPGFGCAVVCEGDLARSAWEGVPIKKPSRRDGLIGRT